MKYLDAHTHAHFAAYAEDWKEVIQRALDSDVWLVNVGTKKETSRRAVEVADLYPEGVYATVGLHPIHTAKSFHDAQEGGSEKSGEDFDPAFYRELLSNPKALAIGECGLDYFHIKENEDEAKNRQREAFSAQIDLSKETGKPLMIHCRNAFHDLIPMLEERRGDLLPEPGIIHFFTGSPEEAKKLFDLGFAFTFGGAITFARNYDDVIKWLPLDRILSETDAPYVTPVPYRGKRNEPAYVVEVVKKLAELKTVQVDRLKEAVLENARRIMKLPG